MIDAQKELNAYFLWNDWNVTYNTDGGIEARKKVAFGDLAGTVTDGTRLVTLRVDGGFRWLEAIDGWGKVIVDVDLRECETVEIAINRLLAMVY